MKAGFKIAAVVLAGCAGAAWAGQDEIRHGRYLVQISGCNDCHTAGFMQNAGQVAEAEWLTGNATGWHGAWGTTYPANLRLLVQQMDEAAWLARARQPMRPPMPSYSLEKMSDADLKAIYRYLKSLGPKGGPAPAYVPPGGRVATPYLDLTPQNLPPQAGK
jgi:mono/diheme cytochrome c family protein